MSSYMDHMTPPEMAAMHLRHPDWIWNRSDVHVFIGLANSPDSFKTVVEPGNSFSPSPGSIGISTWVFTEGKLHAPEEKKSTELLWRFQAPRVPVLVSEWRAGAILVSSELFAEGNLPTLEINDYLTVTLTNTSTVRSQASFFLVLRSFGPAGAAIRELAIDGRDIRANGAFVVRMLDEPTSTGTESYEISGKDISSHLKDGSLPTTKSVKDSKGWASGAVEYSLDLAPNESRTFRFVCPLHRDNPMLYWMKPLSDRPDFDSVRKAFIKKWEKLVPLELEVPDPDYAKALFSQISHLMMSMALDVPRVTPVTYPLWWMRDGGYQITALDKAGLHEQAGRSSLAAAEQDAKTGFGPEADTPGAIIWTLSEHYMLTKSKEFLKLAWPTLRKKAMLIIEMLKTKKPLLFYHDFIVYEHSLRPEMQVMCGPSEDGIVKGRMDHHYPLYYVNGFCYLGLKRAAICARELGRKNEAKLFSKHAITLAKRLEARIPGEFGQNERDTVSSLWPCEWALDMKDKSSLKKKFDEYWDRKWSKDGEMTHEQYWTYFEVGDAHNRMLLGDRKRAWQLLERFLRTHTAQGLYTYPEGHRDENSALLNWEKIRGWDRATLTTPTGWTASELFHILRDGLVREVGDSLLIGCGVPESWMDKDFHIRGFPTHFGKVSWEFDTHTRTLSVSTERKPTGGIKSLLPGDVKLVIRKKASRH